MGRGRGARSQAATERAPSPEKADALGRGPAVRRIFCLITFLNVSKEGRENTLSISRGLSGTGGGRRRAGPLGRLVNGSGGK